MNAYQPDTRSADALVDAAKRGSQSAWNEIVHRHAPLVRHVCRLHGLHGADADDVAGTVWLQLVTHLAAIRDPVALPQWLITTTRRTCLTARRQQDRQIPSDLEEITQRVDAPPDAQLLDDEKRTAVRHTINTLPDRDKQLLSMLFSDPHIPYTQISTVLDMPVGTIGPTRQRCLTRLRTSPAIAALLASR